LAAIFDFIVVPLWIQPGTGISLVFLAAWFDNEHWQ